VNPNRLSVQLLTVKLTNNVLNVGHAGKLHHSLVPLDSMRISEGYFSGITHEILQILPGYSAAQVLHGHPVVGPRWWAVLVQPNRSA